MWRAPSWGRCGSGEPGPRADAAAASPIPVQMWFAVTSTRTRSEQRSRWASCRHLNAPRSIDPRVARRVGRWAAHMASRLAAHCRMPRRPAGSPLRYASRGVCSHVAPACRVLRGYVGGRIRRAKRRKQLLERLRLAGVQDGPAAARVAESAVLRLDHRLIRRRRRLRCRVPRSIPCPA